MVQSRRCSNPGKVCDVGSVIFSLAGLAGFARLCPGDQYEVSFI